MLGLMDPSAQASTTSEQSSCAQRRKVDGSAERVGSLQCGAARFDRLTRSDAFAGLLPAMQL